MELPPPHPSRLTPCHLPLIGEGSGVRRTPWLPFQGPIPPIRGKCPEGTKGVGTLSPKVTERSSQICCNLSVSAFRRATSPGRGAFSLRRGSPFRPCGPAPLDKGSPWVYIRARKKSRPFGLLFRLVLIRSRAQPCWNAGILYRHTHGAEYRQRLP